MNSLKNSRGIKAVAIIPIEYPAERPYPLLRYGLQRVTHYVSY